MKQSFLWITPKWPLPPHDGARLASANLISALAAEGHDITLVALAGDDEAVDHDEARRTLGIREVHTIRREGTSAGTNLSLIKSLALNPLTPLTTRYYTAESVREGMKKILSSNGTSADTLLRAGANGSGTGANLIVVYDGLHPAAHSSRGGVFTPPLGAKHIIYRAHNRESDIWFRKADQTTNPLLRGFLRRQASLVKRFEDSLVRHSTAIATVSEDDLAAFKKAVPSLTGRTVPIGYEFGDPPAFPGGKTLQLMFLGKLDWPPNREGMIWFMENVWPEVSRRREDLKLVVAGSGNGNWLTPYTGLPSVEFRGRVPDVGELYASSCGSLAPLFYGSGTRVKVIEACRFARACLSTSLGVEGTGLQDGKSYLRAESKEEWIERLTSLDADLAASTGKEAFLHGKRVFEKRAAALQFGRLVDDVISGF